jgi:DsbC/DsbD-like thiol-disulfide interchange protein
MRKILNPLAFVAAGLVLVPVLAAQEQEENKHVVSVTSALSRTAVAPGETFKLAVTLKVQAGYHINDNAPLDEFMFPTTLTLDDTPEFEVVEIYYPAGRPARYAYSDVELVVYDGEAVLGVLLRAKDGLTAGRRTFKGTLSYQACDNVSCLPPKELNFEVAVPVSKSGGEDLHPEVFSRIPFKSFRK